MPINFLKGHPSTRLLPQKQISESYTKVLSQSYDEYENGSENRHPLAYGTDLGNLDVRATIADWNNKVFGFKESKPENINLTAGASYGIANILELVTDVSLTKRAFIVTPTYFLINSVFTDLGLAEKLTAVDETPNSEYEIDLKSLEEKLKEYSEGLEVSTEENEINVIKDPLRGDRKIYRFVLYLVPTFSNPGGLTYSIKTRRKLLEIARKFDLLVISDDVYDLLRYTDAEVIPRINYLDQDSIPPAKSYGNSISNATFSKIIAPGLRTGWQETPTSKLVSQLALSGANKSGGSPSQLNLFVVKDLIVSGTLDTIIEKFRETYSKRAKSLLAAVKKYLPSRAVVFGGDGGYFIWISIDGGKDFDHSEVTRKLQEKHNIVLADGNLFDVLGDERGWGKTLVRVCVSFLEEEQIDEGIRVWGEVLKEGWPQLYE